MSCLKAPSCRATRLRAQGLSRRCLPPRRLLHGQPPPPSGVARGGPCLPFDGSGAVAANGRLLADRWPVPSAAARPSLKAAAHHNGAGQQDAPSSPWPSRSAPLPPVISAAGCSADQLLPLIEQQLQSQQHQVLISEVVPEMYSALRRSLPGVQYHARARMLVFKNPDVRKPKRLPGTVALVTSGPSDQAMADQVKLAAEHLGCYVLSKGPLTTRDLPHLMSHLPVLEAADVIITVAGTDPPLPGVLLGLVDAPIVAVPVSPPPSGTPSSSGLGGLQAMGSLLTTLSSAAPGVAVVDMDSPVGAASVAARILRGTAARVNKLLAANAMAAATAAEQQASVVAGPVEVGTTTSIGITIASAGAAAAAADSLKATGAWPLGNSSSSSSRDGPLNGNSSTFAAVAR